MPCKTLLRATDFLLLVDITHEKLSYGNAFLYDKKMNVLFYERNKNGCFIDTLAKFIMQLWNQNELEHEDIKIELDFIAILRKGEYAIGKSTAHDFWQFLCVPFIGKIQNRKNEFCKRFFHRIAFQFKSEAKFGVFLAYLRAWKPKKVN